MNHPFTPAPHEKFRTVASVKRPAARTDADKLKKLRHWKMLCDEGLKGKLLRKRTGLEPRIVRKWAADLNFDLGRHA